MTATALKLVAYGVCIVVMIGLYFVVETFMRAIGPWHAGFFFAGMMTVIVLLRINEIIDEREKRIRGQVIGPSHQR